MWSTAKPLDGHANARDLKDVLESGGDGFTRGEQRLVIRVA